MGEPNQNIEEQVMGHPNVELNGNDQASNEPQPTHFNLLPPRALKDYMYPSRTSQPSCIELPPTYANHFEIKPGVINMLPKFG